VLKAPSSLSAEHWVSFPGTIEVGFYLLLARNLYRRMDESLRASSESIALSLVQERAEGETEAEAAMAPGYRVGAK